MWPFCFSGCTGKTFYLEFSYQKPFPTSIRHCGSHDNRPDCQLARSGRYCLFWCFFFILCPKLPSLIILPYLGVNSLGRSINCFPTCIFRASCKIPWPNFLLLMWQRAVLSLLVTEMPSIIHGGCLLFDR